MLLVLLAWNNEKEGIYGSSNTETRTNYLSSGDNHRNQRMAFPLKMGSLLHSFFLFNLNQRDELCEPAMQNSDMYHNCSSPRALSIRRLNVIARLNPNSSLREAYYFGGVVLPAFKSHTSIAATIYLVFNVFNIAPCVYINSPSASQFR